MAWDANRPVPWRRLVRDWAVYAVIMAVVFALIARDQFVASMLAVAVSLPAYLVIGGVLAKFGYVRKTLAEQRALTEERRAERAAAKAGGGGGGGGASAPGTAPARQRPAPTRRTSTGASQHPRRTNRSRKR